MREVLFLSPRVSFRIILPQLITFSTCLITGSNITFVIYDKTYSLLNRRSGIVFHLVPLVIRKIITPNAFLQTAILQSCAYIYILAQFENSSMIQIAYGAVSFFSPFVG